MGVITDAAGGFGLISACSHVLSTIGSFLDCLPVAVRLCILGSVGLFALFGILKMLT